MKIRVIRERTEALLAIAARALPSSTSENKVSFLLEDRFHRQYEVSERRRKQEVIEAHPAPDGVTEQSLPASLTEARGRAYEMLADEDLPIKKIPAQMRLTAADMPKALKGDDGWKNAVGLASLRRMLGPLYERTGAEIFNDEGPADELEPDEPLVGVENPMDRHTVAG